MVEDRDHEGGCRAAEVMWGVDVGAGRAYLGRRGDYEMRRTKKWYQASRVGILSEIMSQ